MAILKIARMGHPVLSRMAEAVEDPTRPEILSLVRDMVDTLQDIGGVGLAAPQVHVPLRLIIYHVPQSRSGGGDAVPLTVLANPEIAPLGETSATDWESCLSLPGLTGEVTRHLRIHYSGLGLDGKMIEGEAEGFHARVIQHECDHLDGMLYPMRMKDMGSFGFADEVRRRING